MRFRHRMAPVKRSAPVGMGDERTQKFPAQPMLTLSASVRHPADAGLVRHDEAAPPDHRYVVALRAWAT